MELLYHGKDTLVQLSQQKKSTLRILSCSLKHFQAYVSIEAEYLHEVKAPGAVKCIQCKMEVHNSTFASNNGVYGGAIYAMNS